MWEVRCLRRVVLVNDIKEWLDERVASGALRVCIHSGRVMYYSGSNRLSIKRKGIYYGNGKEKGEMC